MAVATDQLDRVFSALADPTRRAMLARLASGEATVTELAAPFDISLPAISKHLKVLERAGLIVRGRERQWRPAPLRPPPPPGGGGGGGGGPGGGGGGGGRAGGGGVGGVAGGAAPPPPPPAARPRAPPPPPRGGRA